jgi:hypothetical protein
MVIGVDHLTAQLTPQHLNSPVATYKGANEKEFQAARGRAGGIAAGNKQKQEKEQGE